jgi:hypothetical protein
MDVCVIPGRSRGSNGISSMCQIFPTSALDERQISMKPFIPNVTLSPLITTTPPTDTTQQLLLLLLLLVHLPQIRVI